MARYRFGEGEYRYFTPPFPDAVVELKRSLYPRLLPIARTWWTRLGRETPWPDTLDEWLDMCHAAGQTRSTPILLKYGEGDWNALHRDLYGDLVFPLQVVINLSVPGVDHSGGEFIVYEQRPRAQSRATAVTIPHGHGLVFTTRDRPVASKRGTSTPRRLGDSLRPSPHARPRLSRRCLTHRYERPVSRTVMLSRPGGRSSHGGAVSSSTFGTPW